MNKLYIFGASKLGEVAYSLMNQTHAIIGFIDNDDTKQGGTFCGLEVFSPSIINESEVEVLIASSYWKEIEDQLLEHNFLNYQIFSINIQKPSLQTSQLVENNLQTISAGALINSLGDALSIDDLTFLSGGSNIMDYFFLKAVAMKQKAKTFLEIGTWTGESVASLADVVERCYSISLPDDNIDLEASFRNYCDKDNFSRYFSRKLKNISHFEESSIDFDYGKINEKIDLVFIDGDHSYQAIKKDTSHIFSTYGYENTIIVWHDFKTPRNELVTTTYEAVKSNIPSEYSENLYAVQGTICGIYIPSKYRGLFELKEDSKTLYSYKVELSPKLNELIV